MPSLPRRLEQLAPERVRARGARYLAERRVVLDRCGAREISARVDGTRSYRTRLRRLPALVFYECDCPYFEQEADLCKHLWATLLAAGRRIDLAGWVARGVDWTPADPHDPADDEIDEELAELDADEEVDDSDDGTDASFDPEPEEPGDDEPAPEPALGPGTDPDQATRRAAVPWTAALRELAREQERGTGFDPDGLGPAVPPGAEVVYVLELRPELGGSGLLLSCETRTPGRDGTWRSPVALRLTRGRVASLPDPADRQALALLAGAPNAGWLSASYNASDYYRAREPVGPRFQLEPFQVATVGALLAATGRLHLRRPGADGKPALGPPIAWNPAPLRARLRVRIAEDGAGCLAHAEVTSGSGAEVGELRFWLVRGGYALGETFLRPLEDGGLFAWLARRRPLWLPRTEVDAFLAALYALPSVPPIELPEELRPERIDEPPRPRLDLVEVAHERWWTGKKRLAATPSFRYGEEVVPFRDPRQAIFELPARRLRPRDPTAERAAFARLHDLGLVAPGRERREGHPLELVPEQLPAMARALVSEGWEVVAHGKRLRSPGRASLAIASGVDWFDLEGGVDFEGEVAPLPTLLAALRNGTGVVELGDGSTGLLPEAWLERHRLLGELGRVEGAKIRFSRLQAPLVESWLADEVGIAADAAFRRLARELSSARGVAAADPPRSFRGTLRGYQREGLGWLRFLERTGLGGCLADDMGLGKTVQILAHLAGRRRSVTRRAGGPRTSLVVAPRSLLFNWRAEAARFTPSLAVAEHHGPQRAKTASELAGFDLVLTTYGTLRSDVELFEQLELDYAILDEAQAVKNAKTASARAVRRLNARHRLTATGTPVENHLGELWSLLDFLNPGAFGAATLLRTTTGAARKLPEETLSRLARAVRPFVLRRTKGEVAPELPAKTEQTIFCVLEGTQRRLYDELRQHYRRSLSARVAKQGWKRSKIHVLEALLRLRQAACHPGLLDTHRGMDGCAKFEALLPRLEELVAEGSKALVFSQFTSLLGLLRGELDRRRLAFEYLDGKTTDRQQRVERFQTDPDCGLFLVSLKAGGFGLNLTAAEYVFLLDPWWNPAVEAQAIDRTHRIGQTRPVFAYRLLATRTIEERIAELQASKRELADSLFAGEGAPLAELTFEDVELLLS